MGRLQGANLLGRRWYLNVADNARKGAESMMRVAKENGKDQVRHMGPVPNSDI